MNIIRYFGGKGTMYNKILEYFPNNYDVYIEPFGGSYSIGFHQKCRIEIYNDLEQNVYSLFKVLSDKILFDKFKEKCDLVYYSEQLRQEFKLKLKNDKDLSITDRAFYFFYVSRTSVDGSGGFSISLPMRRNISKSTSDFLSIIDNLEKFHQRLSNVIICNQDALNIIKKYKGQNVLFYLDPPYVQSTRKSNTRYSVDMNDKQHKELISVILKDKESKFLISGYENYLYKELEINGFKRVDYESSSINNDGNKSIESLWFNYTIKKEQINKIF